MSRLNLEALEKVAISDLRTRKRTLKRIRHWQRRLWKAAQGDTR